MLIAVTSQNDTDVDLHFGHAERFSIYSYNNCKPQLVKKIAVEKYSIDDPNHEFDLPRFEAVAKTLLDCKVLVTKKIGEKPKQELLKLGITTIVYSGSIIPALKIAHDSICEGNCQTQKVQSKDCQCGSQKVRTPITF